MSKELYSTSEVAKILRLSRISVFNRIKLGKIKAERIGRNYVITHKSVMEALGKSIGTEKKANIERAIDKAIREYGETFKLLGRE